MSIGTKSFVKKYYINKQIKQNDTSKLIVIGTSKRLQFIFTLLMTET